MKKPTCLTCLYHYSGERFLECRYNPVSNTGWPPVGDKTGCAKHQDFPFWVAKKEGRLRYRAWVVLENMTTRLFLSKVAGRTDEYTLRPESYNAYVSKTGEDLMPLLGKAIDDQPGATYGVEPILV